ncbi:Hypothetical_protein [Hexamita inflata]|uniref:Hypothetical_protein n=1 Tax=Hexamita inflata TaxID=28002 RepID=A0AA86N7Y4_9EUKA|nr:Hypothetical protein HINF_LOCUS2212 [Hexamita inflata]
MNQYLYILDLQTIRTVCPIIAQQYSQRYKVLKSCSTRYQIVCNNINCKFNITYNSRYDKLLQLNQQKTSLQHSECCQYHKFLTDSQITQLQNEVDSLIQQNQVVEIIEKYQREYRIKQYTEMLLQYKNSAGFTQRLINFFNMEQKKE